MSLTIKCSPFAALRSWRTSIFDATTAKTVVIVKLVTIDIGTIIGQVPVPRLRRRPKVGVATQSVELPAS